MGNDLRYALRTLARNPGFAAVAILSLALGIGANTAIFTVVDAVLLRWLPVQSPEQLFVVARANTQGRPSPIWNYPDYVAFRDRSQSFEGLVAYSSTSPYGFSVQEESAVTGATLAYGLMVSGNYFKVLGVQPAAGRLLNEEDDRHPGGGPYAVLSYNFWRQRFGGDPRMIGKLVHLNRYPLTIVGVSRSGFTGAEVGVAPDLFVPILMRSEILSTRFASWNNRNNWWLYALGRLKSGVPLTQAEAELHSISRQQEEENRRTAVNPRFVNPAQPVRLLPGAQGYSQLRNRLSTPLVALMIVVGLVLLIACANVANLLLARAAARRREIAVRLAIGAGRGRLIRQLLTESMLLSLFGGVAGIGFSYVAVPVLVDLAPLSGWTPIDLAVTPDLRILGFTFVISFVAGAVFGLVPALQSSRPDVVTALKDDAAASAAGGSKFNLRKALVVVQVALSLLLLIGAGLFVRSLRNLQDLDAGFRREQLLIAQVDPLRSGYKRTEARAFYERLRERIESLPGVRAVALASITPLGGSRWNDGISVEGYQWLPGERRYVDMNAVGPRFFETFKIPIVMGRDFRPEDSPVETPEPENLLTRAPGTAPPLTGPRVVIINEGMAKRFFSGQNPIGRRLCIDETFRMDRSYEIIGVVKDARYFGLRADTEPMIYQALWRPGAGSRSVCILTTGDPSALIGTLRREVRSIDSSIPVLNARTMEQQVDNNVMQEKIVATLSSFFGVLALVLASVGLYGVMAHSVARRTREIGIRMALGAQAASVLWLVLRDALLMVLIGAVVGIPVAHAVSRYAEGMLYGITRADALTFVLATIVLLGVAVFASLLPARRATRIDPITALRYE
jgi:predicted permease